MPCFHSETPFRVSCPSV